MNSFYINRREAKPYKPIRDTQETMAITEEWMRENPSKVIQLEQGVSTDKRNPYRQKNKRRKH